MTGFYPPIYWLMCINLWSPRIWLCDVIYYVLRRKKHFHQRHVKGNPSERRDSSACHLVRTCACVHITPCARDGGGWSKYYGAPHCMPDNAWVVLFRQSSLRSLACRITGRGSTEVGWWTVGHRTGERVGNHPHPERVFLAQAALLSVRQQLRLRACGWCVGGFDSHPKN